MALHVADGSQILAQRASGRSLTVTVGPTGNERFGRVPRPPRPVHGFASGFPARPRNDLRPTPRSIATTRNPSHACAKTAARESRRLDRQSAGKSAAIRSRRPTRASEAEARASFARRLAVLGLKRGRRVEGSSVGVRGAADRSRRYSHGSTRPRPATRSTSVRKRTRRPCGLVRYWKNRLAAGPESRSRNPSCRTCV
jgi:hypothetical protein